ncbi:MAG: hypothetical protein NC397_10195 [Clostridium sp.]|nr:hypothetical protein [Clostridium sp.]
MNNNDMNRLMRQAQNKTGIDISKMKAASEQGKLDDFVNQNLSSDASKKLKNVLTDKAACEKLLSTPEAKELMKKLMEGK